MSALGATGIQASSATSVSTARALGIDSLQRVEKRLEPAPEHALAVERHVHRARLHLGVGHDLFPRLVADVLVRPDDEGEDDILILLGLDRTEEIGRVAVLEPVTER